MLKKITFLSIFLGSVSSSFSGQLTNDDETVSAVTPSMVHTKETDKSASIKTEEVLFNRTVHLPFDANGVKHILVRSSLEDFEGFQLKDTRKTREERKKFEEQFSLVTAKRLMTIYDKIIPQFNLEDIFKEYRLGLFSIYRQEANNSYIFVGELNIDDSPNSIFPDQQLELEITLDIDPLYRNKGISKAVCSTVLQSLYPPLQQSPRWLIDWKKIQPHRERKDFFYESIKPFSSVVAIVDLDNKYSHKTFQSLGFTPYNATNNNEIFYIYPPCQTNLTREGFEYVKRLASS